jgi:hypothetical protein
MSTKNAAPLVVGLIWSLIASLPLCATDVRAQAAQAQKDPPASAKADSKRDTSAPATPSPESKDANQAPGENDKPGGAGAPSTSNTQNPSGDAAAAPSSSSSAAPPPEAPSVPPTGSATDVNGTAASSGSGPAEQSQAAEASPTASGTSEEVPEPRSFEFGGYVRGDMYVGKVPDANNGQLKAGYGEFALNVRLRKEQFGDAFAELRLRDGLQGEARGTILDLREAYVNTYLGPLDLRLGKQIIVWGRADAFNPTNNLTPNDLRVRSPIEDDRRVGNIGARAFLNFSPFRLEGVWMPFYVASELPAYKLPQDVYFGTPSYPAPNLDKGLGAGRLHFELPSVDMSVSFVHGYAPLPGLALQKYSVLQYDIGGFDTQILITRTPYQQNVAGFDFSTTIGDYLGVRGEIAYRRPVEYKDQSVAYYTAHPDLQYVLGVDHTFGSVMVIAQYLGRYIFDWRQENGPADPMDSSVLQTYVRDPITPIPAPQKLAIEDSTHGTLAQKNQIIFGQTERIQHLASIRLEWLTLNETLSFSALGLANFSTREWMAYPKITYKISDRMSTAVGGEIYWGPQGTLFGLIKETLSAGYAELRYAF